MHSGAVSHLTPHTHSTARRCRGLPGYCVIYHLSLMGNRFRFCALHDCSKQFWRSDATANLTRKKIKSVYELPLYTKYEHPYIYVCLLNASDNSRKCNLCKGKLLPLSPSVWFRDFSKFKVNPIKYVLCSRVFHFWELGILTRNDMLTYGCSALPIRSESDSINYSHSQWIYLEIISIFSGFQSFILGKGILGSWMYDFLSNFWVERKVNLCYKYDISFTRELVTPFWNLNI